jgi:exopolysaccharide production protein ExoQ
VECSKEAMIDRSEAWFRHSFGAVIFLLAPVGLFAPRAIAVMFVGLAVIALVILICGRGRGITWPQTGIFLLFLLAAWSLLSAVWSITPEKSFQSALTLPPLFVAGICILVVAKRMTLDHRAWVEKCLVSGVVLGAFISFVEAYFGMPITTGIDAFMTSEIRVSAESSRISRGLTVIALLIWPAAFVLWTKGNKLGAAALTCFVALALSGGENEAAIFSMMIGTGVLLLACIFPKRCAIAFGTILGIGILISPMAVMSLPDAKVMSNTVPGLGYGVYPRIFIWQSAAQLIHKKPIIGYGYRSSRAFSSEKDSQFVRIGPNDANKVSIEPIPLHTHNAPLQLWLELGGVGALIALAIILSMITYIHKTCVGTTRRAALFAALITGISVASISYGLWQGWWQSLLWIVSALNFVLVAEPCPTQRRSELQPHGNLSC